MPIVAAIALLAVQAATQEPTAFAQASVLQQVREAGFLPHQVVALRDASIAVDGATLVLERDHAALEARDGDLKPALEALLAGQALTSAQTGALRVATSQRKAAQTRWSQSVEAAVTRVLGTLNDAQKYKMGIPPNVRERVEMDWNTFMQSPPSGEKAEQQWVTRVMLDEYTRAKASAGGSSDRGAAADKRQAETNLQANFAEIERQGREFLNQVRSGNPAATQRFRQQLARGYMKSDVDATLRDLIRSIITAEGASAALTAAVKGGR